MRTYCFRSCISVSHSNDYSKENIHVHTVEIAVFMRLNDMDSEVIKFEDTEALINVGLESYKECCLNEMEGFEEDVSMEHLGDTMFELLDQQLKKNNIYLNKLEIGETPLRTYIVTRTI